jgi:phosphoribosyl-ATP pyrophosphohydrolase/phosphoribosyl-AMP cyclohydrolase
MHFIDNLHFDQNGLIPAIAQDWVDGSILMMAWMNKESITKTLECGEVHYWSRSRRELWHKGKTSGHFQKLKGIRTDCDSDTILLSIEQIGSIACHTGKRSCFFRDLITNEDVLYPPSDACNELFNVIESRKSDPEEGSYTNSLLKEGDNKILKKIGEETAEFIMACKDKNPISIANEAADLLFHLQVSLAHQNVSWEDVLKVLIKRRGGPRRNQ